MQKLIQKGERYRIVVLDKRLPDSPLTVGSDQTNNTPKSVYDYISSDDLMVWHQPCTKTSDCRFVSPLKDQTS